MVYAQISKLRLLQFQNIKLFQCNKSEDANTLSTIKLAYNNHPRDPEIEFFVDKWSLCNYTKFEIVPPKGVVVAFWSWSLLEILPLLHIT